MTPKTINIALAGHTLAALERRARDAGSTLEAYCRDVLEIEGAIMGPGIAKKARRDLESTLTGGQSGRFPAIKAPSKRGSLARFVPRVRISGPLLAVVGFYFLASVGAAAALDRSSGGQLSAPGLILGGMAWPVMIGAAAVESGLGE